MQMRNVPSHPFITLIKHDRDGAGVRQVRVEIATTERIYSSTAQGETDLKNLPRNSAKFI